MESDIQQENIVKYSLGGVVFNRIRENILNGVYKENEELKENALAKEIGVSRTPVREALRQLELEGLVHIIPNKGAYVTGITLKDVKDIYEMRALLEGLCARKVVENINEKVIGELESIVDLSEFYCSKGKIENVLELDNKFHQTMYDTAGSKILKHTLTDFHHYLERIRKTTLMDIKRANASNEEHRAIVVALKEKDSNKASELATLHMHNAMHNIAEHGYFSLNKS